MSYPISDSGTAPSAARVFSSTDMALANLTKKVDELTAKINIQQETLNVILKDHEARLRRVEISMFILPFILVIAILLVWVAR